MIKGAIFDVDGTLLDSMEIWEDAGARYLKSINIEPEEDLSEILFPMTIEEAAIYMKKQYALPVEVSEVIQGVLDTVRNFYYTEAPLKEGAEALLKSFEENKIPIAAATSSDKEHIKAAFGRLGVEKYFKEIITCQEIGAGKDKPVIYQEALKCLETKPEETYVFEDVLYAVKTAKNAGFRTVGVYDRFSADKEKEMRDCADFYVTGLTELLKPDKFWKTYL